MQIPAKLYGLRRAIILFVIAVLIWISLEGDPRWSSLMAIFLLLIGTGLVIERIFGGKKPAARSWIVLCSVIGAVIGLLFLPTTLFFMALKTGLHGHGQEFSQAEISWLLDRFIIWAITGLVVGLGLGLLALGFSRSAK